MTKTLPRLKVAAYIRVSTDLQDQENSYAVQEQYFQQIIESNPLWKLVGIYSDYGISGTSKEKRVGFLPVDPPLPGGKDQPYLM